MTNELEPFGAPSTLVRRMPSATLVAMYASKCGADVGRFFAGLPEIGLHECTVTGMRFWRPSSLAGDEDFYRDLSQRWPDYYQSDRWEYAPARTAIGGATRRVLEIGCGRGYFLRSLEPLGHEATGIEYNNSAIERKVTRFEILNRSLDEVAAGEPASFDAACSFQVLEHVSDPAAFIRGCIQVVRPGGLIVLSTPNRDFPIHAQGLDAFDMPPHHLNHFSDDTFRRVAAHLGLQTVSVQAQVDMAARAAVWVGDGHSGLERALRGALNRALRLTFGVRHRPGHTLLAVLRRPA